MQPAVAFSKSKKAVAATTAINQHHTQAEEAVPLPASAFSLCLVPVWPGYAEHWRPSQGLSVLHVIRTSYKHPPFPKSRTRRVEAKVSVVYVLISVPT